MDAIRNLRESPIVSGVFIALITAFALPVAGVIILIKGVNPLQAYGAMIEGAFGSVRAITETARLATPLLLIGLGLVLAFRCKTWNIGAEGQYLIGGLSAVWVGLTWGETAPSAVIIPMMLLIGTISGALWATLPGLLKAQLGISEIVVSLMMNFIALFGLAYIVRVPLKNPEYYLPQTAQLSMTARLPALFGTRIHVGVLIALASVFLVNYVLWRTTFGYELRAVGANVKAAEVAGISVSRSIVLAMMLSGAFAGLAGAIQVMGVYFYAFQELAAGYGYTAVLIVILGQMNPYGVLLTAFLFAALVIGADFMQRAVGLQQALVHFIQATVVMFFLIGNAIVKRR